jgi:hypothetical protein
MRDAPAQFLGRALAKGAGTNVLIVERSRVADTRLTSRKIRLAAITSAGPHKVYPRAQHRVIVDDGLIRDGKPLEQVQHPVVVPDQMMHLGAHRVIGLQYPNQQVQFPGDREAKVRRSAFGAVAQHAIAAFAVAAPHRPEYDRAKSRGSERRRPLRHVPLDAASTAVGDQQYGFLARPIGFPTLQVQVPPRLRHRIVVEKRADERVVARVQPVEHAHIALNQVMLRRTERLTPDMPHE